MSLWEQGGRRHRGRDGGREGGREGRRHRERERGRELWAVGVENGSSELASHMVRRERERAATIAR